MRSSVRRRGVLGAGLLAAVGVLAGCNGGEPDVTVGLITKQEDNPYWVTMREIAEDTAQDLNVELISVTGASDVDVETQLEALADMTAREVDGILIAPTDSTAVVDAIAEAREAGITVIAVDTPTEPPDAADATFATDNNRAGELVGEYARAKAAELGLTPSIAILDLAPGIASGEHRREGFLAGFGLDDGAEEIAGEAHTEGNRDLGYDAMVELLAVEPGINIVYAVNEPAALGAVDALQETDADLDEMVIVTIDGGCEAIKDAVRPGLIDATAQQYPENMAREGVTTLAATARGEEPAPSGFFDTGVVLVTGNAADGVDSRDVAFGVRNCWGE